MKINFRTIIFIFTLFSLIIIYSCSKSNNNTVTPPDNNNTDPVIQSLDNTMGPTGSTITISGKNFGNTQSKSFVTFNGEKAIDYIGWTKVKVVVVVPAKATTGNVVLTVDSIASNGVKFTVTAIPIIISLDVVKANTGQTIGIIGSNFGDAQGSSYVTFAGVKATIFSSWTNTKIAVTVPDNAATGKVVVWINSLPSNGVDLTIIQKVYMVETVLVQPGVFAMGPDLDWNGPAHQVTISKAFYMGKYEITQRQYQKVSGSNPSQNNQGSNLVKDSANMASYPVERITWLDAVIFCNNLSQQEGLTPCYKINSPTDSFPAVCDFSANGWRLPTEGEWEFACRAGSANISYGDIINMGHTNSDTISKVSFRIGTKTPNAWGIYDMYGNVAEWVWDLYDDQYYTSNPITDPTGPRFENPPDRVYRGGGFQDGPANCIPNKRYSADYSAYGSYELGFRIVRNK